MLKNIADCAKLKKFWCNPPTCITVLLRSLSLFYSLRVKPWLLSAAVNVASSQNWKQFFQPEKQIDDYAVEEKISVRI